MRPSIQRFAIMWTCLSSLSHISLAVVAPSIASSQLLFDEGMVLFKQKNYRAAQKCWEAYLNTPGKQYHSSTAAYYRILSALKNKEPDIEMLVQHFTIHYANNPQIDSLRYRLARFFFQQGALHKCLAWHEKINVKKLLPREQDVYPYVLANVYLENKDWSNAKKFFTKIRDKNHLYYYPTQLRIAYIALQQKQYDQAVALLEEIHKHIDDLPEIRNLTVEVYHKSCSFEKLLAYVAHFPNTTFTKQEQLLIGDAYFFLKQYQTAITYYQAYLSDGVYDPKTLVKLGYALYATQQHTHSLHCFKQLKEQRDDTGQVAAYYSGLIYEKEHAVEAALEAFEKASKLKFNLELSDLAAIKRASLYYQQNAFQQVIQAMCTFMEENKSSKHLVTAQVLLIKSYYQTKAYTQAIDYITTLPYKNETLLRLHQKLLFYQGLEAYNQGMLDTALSHLKESLHFPFKASLASQARFWIAEAFAALGAYEKSLKFYTQLMEQGSVNTLYHEKTLYGLAYAYFNTGHYNAAAIAFKQYVDIAPGQPAATHYDAMLRLGDCYYVSKNYEQALAVYERVYAYNPAHVRYQEALIYQILGNTTEATQCLQEIITQHTITPYYDKACYQEACMAFHTGHYEIAIQKFSALLPKESTLDWRPDLLMKRALAYENLQKNNEAASDYRAILEQFPTHAHAESALMALSNLWAAEGKTEQIEHYLKKYKQIANALTSHSDVHTLDAIRKRFYSQAYHKVLQQLTAFYRSYPHSTLLPEAYLLMAESYYRLHTISQAIHYYKKVMASKQCTLHIKAGSRLADLMYERKNFQEALHYYQKLQKMELMPTTYERVLMGIIKSSFVLKKYQVTLPACFQLLNHPNVTSVEVIQQTHLYLGKVFMHQSEYKSAKNHFIKASMPLHTVAAAEAQYLLAHVAFTLKAYNVSLSNLFTLIEQFPHHTNYIDQAFLLMADNYLCLGNLTQAKATLDSIIHKSKNQKTIALAKKKKNEVCAALNANSKADLTVKST